MDTRISDNSGDYNHRALTSPDSLVLIVFGGFDTSWNNYLAGNKMNKKPMTDKEKIRVLRQKYEKE